MCAAEQQQQPKRKREDFFSPYPSSSSPSVSKVPRKEGQKMASRGGGGGFGAWNAALSVYVLHPERSPESIILRNDTFTVIRDLYPKARHHFLVLPNSLIESVNHLTSSHISLINQMTEVADEITQPYLPTHSFLYGFHAIPSMRYLHMHVISDDLQSDKLKNKKHWNSFATPFLVPPADVIEQLNQNGKIVFDSAKYNAILKQQMKCHHCGMTLVNIPKLKMHQPLCLTQRKNEKKETNEKKEEASD
mmetsp:Transcript_11353/g.15108  ORF Transcript_11353/g.15108 Transcript_11353/m.15108 type:complete len:248 (-) Transcript_11353:76-819(-)